MTSLIHSFFFFFFFLACPLLLPNTDSIRMSCFDKNSIYITMFMHLKLQNYKRKLYIGCLASTSNSKSCE